MAGFLGNGFTTSLLRVGGVRRSPSREKVRAEPEKGSIDLREAKTRLYWLIWLIVFGLLEGIGFALVFVATVRIVDAAQSW